MYCHGGRIIFGIRKGGNTVCFPNMVYSLEWVNCKRIETNQNRDLRDIATCKLKNLKNHKYENIIEFIQNMRSCNEL